jgi:general secretion pathway protein D
MEDTTRLRCPRQRSLAFLTALLASGLLASGCASGRRVRLAQDLRQAGRYEQALEQYLKEMRAHPQRLFLRLEIDRLLKEGAGHFRGLADAEAAKGNADQAVAFYRKALEFDPGDDRARRALAGLQPPDPPSSWEPAEAELPPPLPAAFTDGEPFDIEFRSRISLMEVFRSIARSARTNILFDPEFKDQPVAVSLRQVSFAEALERLCQMFSCRYYVLGAANILVAADTPDSRDKYQDRVLKTLYFSNTDAEEAKQILDSVFKPARLIANKPGNSLIVVDSAENMAVVERIARAIDKRSGEVEIEADILEIDSKKLREFGSELSSWSLGASLAGSDKGISPDVLGKVSASADLRLALPTVLWRFLSTVTDSNILARPRIRGLDKERIEVQLGEKRPIATTTFVPVAQGGVNQQPITSYTMTDVGIQLNITPTIHHNQEITLALEFILTYVIDPGGAYLPPTLGNRRVNTKLRLRDGETGIIAGLMRGSSTNSRSGFPVLNQIPILRDIFSANERIHERTDILLSITPRILRQPDISADDVRAWQIGTGDKAGLRPAAAAAGARRPAAAAPAAPPAKGNKPNKKKQRDNAPPPPDVTANSG